MDNKYATIMRQAFFVLFEIEAHKIIEKGATVDEINAIYLKNLESQFGQSVEIPDHFKHEWKYVPHFFHTPFYCYAYAFGDLLGLSLYDLYKTQKEAFPERYHKFLAFGGSVSPIESIEKAFDVNAANESFWQRGFDIIQEEFEILKKML
jgi:oligoendopeptidase F